MMTTELAVKPLVWTKEPPPARDAERGALWATGLGGHYKAESDGMLWMAHDGFVWRQFETQKAAKEFAQRDHEERVRKILTWTTKP